MLSVADCLGTDEHLLDCSLLWRRVKSNSNLKGLTRRENMTYKAYIDNIKAKTGKDPEYFQKLAKEKGLVKHTELISWLKSDCRLGRGPVIWWSLYLQYPTGDTNG